MNLDFSFYLKLLLRRLPVMAVFIIVASTLCVISALKLPETWESSARLLVEAPQIPDNMVRSTVRTDAIEQLDITQQRLLTRANLIDIANKHSVFEDIREMEPDTVVELMRDAATVRRTAGQNRATLLTISFEARSGQIAANVVNEFVTIVLEENSNFRLSRAENTLEFFEGEVERLSEELSEQSLKISDFKSENVTALPENQTYRLGRQNLLQERLERLEREVAVGKAQRDDLVELYESTGQVGNVQGQVVTNPNQRRLMAAREQLDQALLLYSENHPRVTKLKETIATLEERAALQSEEEDVASDENTGADPRLQAVLIEIDTRLTFLDEEVTKTKDELAKIQVGIQQSSANGIVLNELEREFNIISNRYNAAISNLNAAKMSERIESTAQGQRVTVIENANVPRVPTGPDRPRVAIMGAAVGFGLAGAYFLLLEILNRRIRRPAEMIARFNITPITTIPYMESRQHRYLRRSAIVGATLFVLISVPVALWYVDTHYLPLEIVVQKGLTRLGLG